MKIGDIVNMPLDQIGVVIKIQDILWGHRYVCKVLRGTLNDVGDIYECKASEITIPQPEVIKSVKDALKSYRDIMEKGIVDLNESGLTLHIKVTKSSGEQVVALNTCFDENVPLLIQMKESLKNDCARNVIFYNEMLKYIK